MFEQPTSFQQLQQGNVGILEESGEIHSFLEGFDIQPKATESNIEGVTTIVVGEGVVRSKVYQKRIADFTTFVNSGGTMFLVEPEFGVEGREIVPIVHGVELTIEKRIDADKGGYDSYVFAEDYSHPLWKGISQEYLKMFNGGLGGEVVSQHNVSANIPVIVHVRCGLNLDVHAVFEIPSGKGKIIVTRLQLRGRLVSDKKRTGLYERRVDPVLQQYFLNLLSYANH
ncbi:MAG: hypothetical protein HYZ34_14290 [Ignavibacteriae bacterium]|nr:hypothetical protein [Ignavibacteriota bacterium]